MEESLKAAAAQPDYACFTAHAESEGMGHKAVLESFLAKLGRPTVPLGEARRGELPRRDIRFGRVPGRPYDVCLQTN